MSAEVTEIALAASEAVEKAIPKSKGYILFILTDAGGGMTGSEMVSNMDGEFFDLFIQSQYQKIKSGQN